MAPADTVEVTGIAPLVRAQSSAMGAVIDNRQVSSAARWRNFYQLGLLLPGVRLRPRARGSFEELSRSASTEREDANNFYWTAPTMASEVEAWA